MFPTTSKRWCPTPEQLMILEELYTRGLRTPNSTQIQKITAHLAYYGKIQGKNVFYWFQNHKARDRQKLRKKLAKQFHQQQLLQQHLIVDVPQNQYNPLFFFDFQAPAAPHPLFHSYPTENIDPQVTGSRDEIPEVVATVRTQPWPSSDLPQDFLMRTCGHDSMMITEVGPIYPCCPRDRPLQTLQLFPLRSDREPHLALVEVKPPSVILRIPFFSEKK